MFRLSKFEKIFWATILLFLVIYLTIYIVAYQKSKQTMKEHNKTVIKDILKENYEEVVKYTTIIKELPDRSIKEALENNATLAKIHYDLENQTQSLDKIIDTYINGAFGVIYRNIDSFLDFHYSVIGEYTELGAMATGKIEQSIQKRLFPKEFDEQIQGLNRIIAKEFKAHSQKHLAFMDKTLTKDIDTTLNAEVLERLKSDINHHIKTQQVKISAVVTIGIAAMVAKVVASKIAIKAYSKVAIKSSTKMATKGATTGAAAATGALCGPAVVICSPILATAAWFGSDKLLVEADEYLHRDQFKKEIIASIDQQKEVLKADYKRIYLKSLEKLSRQMREAYQEGKVIKKVRVKIIDKITE
jgi:preprotein translocase subunit YajC